MSIAKVFDFLSDGIGSKIVDTVKEYYPPSMSESEKSELSLRIDAAANKQTNEAIKLANEAQVAFDKRTTEMEGTASDLIRMGWLGSIIIFLRGSQRIVWGYGTLYLDIMVFNGSWKLIAGTQENSFYLINLLVLGFLFGERAIKNVMPIITQFMQARK